MGHDVRTFLTQTETVTKSSSLEDEVRSALRYFKPGTLEKFPAKGSADNQLEVPAADYLSPFALESYEFDAARVVTLCDFYPIES